MTMILVSTATGSKYLLDFEKLTQQRVTVGEDSQQLRRDGEEIRFLRLGLRLGHEMVMLLDLRGDGIITVRQTSTVVGIEEIELDRASINSN
jgi:hypothetical protein